MRTGPRPFLQSLVWAVVVRVFALVAEVRVDLALVAEVRVEVRVDLALVAEVRVGLAVFPDFLVAV